IIAIVIPFTAKSWFATPLRFTFSSLLVFLLAAYGTKAYFHFSLYPAVVIMESVGGKSALTRSGTLSRRLWRTVITILLSYTIVFYLVFPLLVSSLCRLLMGQFTKWFGMEVNTLIITGVSFSLI